MYTKSNHRDNGEIIIPDNYRGNVLFNDIAPATVPLGAVISQETPAAPTVEIETSPEEKNGTKQVQGSILTSLLPPKRSQSNGLLSEIGLEEILIVGILILLSQNDADDDILWLLFLLLFYK